MAKIEQLNSYLEVKQQTDRDVRLQGALVSARYEADSTDSQTVINLPFTVTQDADQKRAFQLYVDGRLLSETNDYTFTGVSSNLSAQVTLTAPLIAGLPIQALKIGAYQENYPNASSVTATLVNDVNQPHKMAQDAFQPFVKKTFITAPYTTIVNRAQVEAASLKPIIGIERIPCRSIALNKNEVGASGEPVYEIENKDSRIRFVGQWFQLSNAYGNYIHTNTLNDYVEVTFYGTGLNILIVANNADSWLVSTDGGADTALVLPALSSVIAQRNYTPNQIINIVSGLSVGWHTVKIKNNNATNGMPTNGFEVLNERSTVGILAGTAYNGTKQDVLSSLSSTSYSAGISGTRGARVVKYLKDGSISQVVTEVNASAAYLSSADHTNEEIVRKINFLEFGAQRSDDFSVTLSGTARAFTLEDGTTTLTASAPSTFSSILDVGGNGAFVVITFVGTGLDVIRKDNANGGADTYQIYVDGALQGTWTSGSTLSRQEKIVSGLPYGTHVVKILRVTAVTFSVGLSDFIIYQPKKPTIPSGAIEVADYNVMANYIANATSGLETIATGIMRKHTATREAVYFGTWSQAAISGSNIGGFETISTTANDYLEYTFFGTGFEWRFESGSVTNTWTISVDGSSNLSSYTTSFYGAGISSFTASTGAVVLAALNTAGNGARVSGIPLGLHKVRITRTSGAGNCWTPCLDIITPIHINLPSTRVGSLSIRDTRLFSPIADKPEKIDTSKAKVLLTFDITNNKILFSSNVSSVLVTSTGRVYVYFEKPFKNANYIINGSAKSRNWNISDVFPSYLMIENLSQAFAYETSTYISITCFGELDDEGDI